MNAEVMTGPLTPVPVTEVVKTLERWLLGDVRFEHVLGRTLFLEDLRRHYSDVNADLSPNPSHEEVGRALRKLGNTSLADPVARLRFNEIVEILCDPNNERYHRRP